MLNRRLLRVKVIQYVYSYLVAEKSNFFLAEDYISEQFQSNYQTKNSTDKQKLEEQKRIALEAYYHVSGKKECKISDFPDFALTIGQKANEIEKNNNNKDKKKCIIYLQNELENINFNYYVLLYFLIKLYDVIMNELERKYNFKSVVPTFFEKINQIDEIQKIKNRSDWYEQTMEIVYTIYKQELLKNLDVLNFVKTSNRDLETDRTFFKMLYTEHLTKSALLDAFMENLDLNWSYNKLIIKDMVVKTIRKFSDDVKPEQFLVKPSMNWEEDKLFCIELLTKTLDTFDNYKSWVRHKLQNWDLERVALIDLSLIYTAIAEMIHFPSIPIKVTINEFVEISKNFVDSSNKNFINGILDMLAKDLENQKIILKSGRGLLDNR
jgi:N utilization substance protein B